MLPAADSAHEICVNLMDAITMGCCLFSSSANILTPASGVAFSLCSFIFLLQGLGLHLVHDKPSTVLPATGS